MYELVTAALRFPHVQWFITHILYRREIHVLQKLFVKPVCDSPLRNQFRNSTGWWRTHSDNRMLQLHNVFAGAAREMARMIRLQYSRWNHRKMSQLVCWLKESRRWWCRPQWPRGLQPLACWDCGFESQRGNGCLSAGSVVCCQAEVSATSWSLVQRSPTDCGVSLCVIWKPRDWEGPGPLWALVPKKNTTTTTTMVMSVAKRGN